MYPALEIMKHHISYLYIYIYILYIYIHVYIGSLPICFLVPPMKSWKTNNWSPRKTERGCESARLAGVSHVELGELNMVTCYYPVTVPAGFFVEPPAKYDFVTWDDYSQPQDVWKNQIDVPKYIKLPTSYSKLHIQVGFESTFRPCDPSKSWFRALPSLAGVKLWCLKNGLKMAPEFFWPQLKKQRCRLATMRPSEKSDYKNLFFNST